MASGNIDIVVRTVDQASRGLAAIQGKVGGVASAMGGALRAGALAGGVAVAGLTVAAVKMAASFQTGIAEVRTLLPELSDKGFSALNKQVLDLSKEMGVTTGDLIPALYQAISAGIPQGNVIDFLRTGAKASIGGVTDLATVVDGLSTVVNAFGLEASETGRVADVMFTGVKLGKTTMQELSQSMFHAAPLAASLGLKIEDVVAATATLTKSGTPTGVAMTQVRQAMVGLARPTADMVPLLEKTGFSSGEALLKAKGFAGALEVLTKAAGGNKEVLAKAFGSVEALQAVLGLTGDNAVVAAADLAAVTDSAGASEEAFLTMEQTMSRKLAKAINVLKVTLTELGLKILPILIKGIEKGSLFIQLFLGGFREMDVTSSGLHGKIEKFGVGVRKAFDDLRPVVRRFAELFLTGLQTIFPVVKAVFEFIINNKVALIAAIAAIGAAILLALGPGALAVAALVGLIALIGLVKENWTEIEATVKATVDKIIATVTGLPIIGTIVETVFGNIKRLVQFYMDAVRAIIKIVTALIKGDWGMAWQGVKDLFNAFWALIKGSVKSAFDGLVGLIKGYVTVYKAAAGLVFDGVLALIKGYIGLYKMAGELVFNGLRDGFKLGINAAIGVVEKGINYIIDKWNGLEFKLPKIDLPLGAGSIGGGTIGTPDVGRISIPRLARGGFVAKTGLAIVHEGERFSGVGRGLSPTITINISGTWDLSNPNHIEQLTSALTGQIRRNLAMGA